MSSSTPPPNDDLADARALPTTPGPSAPADRADLSAATLENGEPNVGPNSRIFGAYGLPLTKSAWWTWTPSTNARVRVTGGAFYVYEQSGPGWAGLAELPTPGQFGAVEIDALVGVTYAIQVVTGYGGGSLMAPEIFTLGPPPSNDDYPNAAALVLGVEHATVLSGATTEAGEPGLVPHPFALADTKSAWWTWTAPVDARIGGHAPCNNFHAYRVQGAGFAGLVSITNQSSFELNATAGTRYVFQCSVPYGSVTSTAMRLDQLANHATAPSEGAAPGTITIQSPQGTYVVNADVAALTGAELPAGVVDLTGAVSYGITNVVPGSTVRVTITLPEGSAPDSAFKFVNGVFTDVTGLATIDGDAMTLTLTDGGDGDADGVADGRILDPVVVTRTVGGPGTPVFVTSRSLGGGTVGTGYLASLRALGGVAPYAWRVATGTLPPGLTMSASGVVSGVPRAGGTFTFTAGADDSSPSPATGTRVLRIVVTAVGFRVTTASLASGAVGRPYQQTLVATGGTAPYKWKKVGKLPPGLKLRPKTGVIVGTPKKVRGTFTFSVQVSDSKKPKPKRTATKSFAIRIT